MTSAASENSKIAPEPEIPNQGFFERLREFLERYRRAPERPPDWTGHWSATYGNLLARTFGSKPSFDDAAPSVSIGTAPRPFHEALDPVRSNAEPIDRNGQRLPWRLSRSLAYDLFGPLGLALGALSIAAAAFTIVVKVANLPPLFVQTPSPPSPVRPPPVLPQQVTPRLEVIPPNVITPNAITPNAITPRPVEPNVEQNSAPNALQRPVPNVQQQVVPNAQQQTVPNVQQQAVPEPTPPSGITDLPASEQSRPNSKGPRRRPISDNASKSKQ